ncbi:MAG: hypothetical protein ACLUN4_03965 [Lachnospiraceae bacterium]
MRYLIAAHTDVGIKKKTNQDSYMIKEAQTKMGRIFLVFCVMVWVACRMENWPVRP